MSKQNFINFLITEATIDESKQNKIKELKHDLNIEVRRYEAGDRHTPDETEQYKKTVAALKKELNDLQGIKKSVADPQDLKQKNADDNYNRAKDFIQKNTPKLEKLKKSKDHQERLKTGFKRGSWQVAILQTHMDNAQKVIDEYMKKGKVI